jgi:hypothetical protein
LSLAWWDELRVAYEVFRNRLAESTVGRSHEALAEQVVETRALFERFFEKCFMAEAGSNEDAGQCVVMQNAQLLGTV